MKTPLITPNLCWCCGTELASFQKGQLCLACNAEMAAQATPQTREPVEPAACL